MAIRAQSISATASLLNGWKEEESLPTEEMKIASRCSICYVPMQQKIRRDVISEASWLLSKEPLSHHVRHCTSSYVSLRRRIRLRWVKDTTALGDGFDFVGWKIRLRWVEESISLAE